MASEIPMSGTKCMQCGKPFEGSYAAVKVGEPMWVHDTCGRAYQEAGRKYTRLMSEKYYPSDDPPPSLSLLVIDLGDCCVVRVEKGCWAWPTIGDLHLDSMGEGGRVLIDKPFADLRAALEGGKPVPRIEREGDDHLRVWTSYSPHSSGGSLTKTFNINQEDYDALSELCGKPLPIWEGNGTWEQLYPFNESVGAQMPELGLRIWRYTR